MSYIGASENQTGVPVGNVRTKHQGIIPEPKGIVAEPPREIPDEVRTLHLIIEDLDRLMSRLIERLDPISCHTPQPCEKNQEPPPNKTSCGQSIREARTKIANVCSRLSEQLEALEL